MLELGRTLIALTLQEIMHDLVYLSSALSLITELPLGSPVTKLELKWSSFPYYLCHYWNSGCQWQSQKLMTKTVFFGVSFRFTAILITCVFLLSFQDKSYVFSSPWLSSDALNYLAVFLYLGIEAGMLYFV